MSFKRLHYDLALKQEVIVYAERRGIKAAGFNLILLKQTSVTGPRTATGLNLFILRKMESVRGPKKGKESYPYIEFMSCFIIETHIIKVISIKLSDICQTLQLKTEDATAQSFAID